MRPRTKPLLEGLGPIMDNILPTRRYPYPTYITRCVWGGPHPYVCLQNMRLIASSNYTVRMDPLNNGVVLSIIGLKPTLSCFVLEITIEGLTQLEIPIHHIINDRFPCSDIMDYSSNLSPKISTSYNDLY